MNVDLHIKAIDLRTQGFTYTEIANRLGGLSKSTLSNWLKNVPLSTTGALVLEEKKKQIISENQKKGADAAKEKKVRGLRILEQQNSHITSFLADVSVRKIILAILYLGEGGKNRDSVYFGNSDPKVISMFLQLLRMSYKIDESKFRITVQCRADQDFHSLENFWSQRTNIPLNQFYKSRIDKRTIGKPSKNKGYMAVCRIDYFSVDVFNELTIIANLISRALSSAG